MTNNHFISQKFKLAIFFVFAIFALKAQVPTVGDCLGAIPVCDEIYEESDSPVGPGNYTNEINSSNCVQLEMNSVWYIFTVQNTGDFGFVLTPNDLSDDYDWSLFNLTGKSCEDIESDPTMTVSCNAAGGTSGGENCNGVTGADGGTPYDFQNFGCGQDPPVNNGFLPLNALVPVQAGNTYALLIINWSGSVNGYTLDFSQSAEVGIFDLISPQVDNAELPQVCGDNTINLEFSENIKCNTFDGSAISINGPGGPYTVDVTSVNCAAGGDFSTDFTLTVSPPFETSGTYTISIDNSPTDLCANPLIENQFQFTLDKIPEGMITSLDSVFCGEFSYVIDATEAPGSTYLWDDGSTDPTLSVNNSGTYTVYIEGPCFTRTQEYTVLFQGFPVIETVVTEPDACQGNFGSINVTASTGSAPFTYSLDDIDYQNSALFENLATGEYTVYIQDIYGCEDSQTVFVDEETSTVDIVLENEFTIELDQEIQINAEIEGNAVDYYWTTDSSSLSCINCLDPIASPLFTTTYTLNVLDDLGCIKTQDITIRVIIPRDVYFPNIFSPNDDNVNDRFFIASGNQLKNIDRLTIYSRWGEKVFEAEDMIPGDPNSGWDGRFKGRTVNPSVFVYVAEITYVDDVKETISGTISVIK